MAIANIFGLLNDSELILAYESFENIGPQTSAKVLKVLRKIKTNGKSVIMPTHD